MAKMKTKNGKNTVVKSSFSMIVFAAGLGLAAPGEKTLTVLMR
ncbi:hypothetical protein [Massilia brevitalea]|nr:hypothetical protein [Massilia brevitalea]